MPDTEAEVTREDVTAMPPSEEGFDGEAVPVLLDLVTDRLRDYVSSAAENDEPISLLGFGMELIYQTGYQDAETERRGRRK
jgi:hypothetical protein